MTTSSLLSALFFCLCSAIALFYLCRLMCGHRWLMHVDRENEVGHGLMAVGMIFMFAPVGSFPSTLLLWNILLFAAASLWWTARLFVHKPLLVYLARGSTSAPSTFQADGIHVFMQSGMCYMFVLMSNMALSMTRLASSASSLFLVAFALLTSFYGREIARDLQAARKDWFQ
ncbi:MAG: DUF5134 domain-containing protein, partial [Ktedonobacteraceae bacterium]